MLLKKYTPCLLAPLLMFSAMAQANIRLSINSLQQSEDTLAIAIGISGLNTGFAPSLASYDFDLEFDPSQLSFVSATFGDDILGNQLDLSGSTLNPTTAFEISTGLLNLSEVAFSDSVEDLNTWQNDSFTLATLNFALLKTRQSQFNLLINSLGDAEGNPLLADNLSVSITTVPLPSALFLMLSGLVVMRNGMRYARAE